MTTTSMASEEPDYERMAGERESSLNLICKKSIVGSSASGDEAGEHQQLVTRLRSLHDGCSLISAFAHEYDYSPDVRANGFRSFVQLVTIYLNNLSLLLPNGQPVAKKDAVLLSEYLSLTPVLLKQLDIMWRVRAKDEDGPHDRTIITDLDIEIMESLLSFTVEDVKPFFSRVGPFYLRSDIVASSRAMSTMFCIAFSPRRKLHRLLFSRERRAQYQSEVAFNQNIKTMRKTIAKLDKFPFKQMMWLAVARERSTRSQYVDVPKLREWNIVVPDCESVARMERQSPSKEHEKEEETKEKAFEKTVKCLIIRKGSGNESPNDSLIFHAHGGGFILANPGFHERYLKTWVAGTGVPVICPDYGKAPEKAYPSGLQDLLDVYLFLTSGCQEATNILGFEPKNVILTGDSSGGNMSLALLIALNDIRKRDPCEGSGTRVKMPSALVLQYPAANPSFVVNASAALVNLDTALPAAACLTCFSLYPQVQPKIEDPLWFRKKEGVPEIIRRFTARVKDPLVNILAYDRFEEVKEVKLFLAVAEFDPLLDQGIDLAKRWQGETVVDVARRQQHGFIAFGESDDKTGSKPDDARRVIQRLNQALDLHDDDVADVQEKPQSVQQQQGKEEDK